MRILGIDPGVTSGWCLYDDATRRVLDRGQFAGHTLQDVPCLAPTAVVIERPQGYGVTRPQMVDCGYVTGRIVEAMVRLRGQGVLELTRREVKLALSEATQRDVVVTDDATAWAALKLLHGDLCDKKGGALHGVKAHERAALAVAVAFALRRAKPAEIAP
jgi:hypothetical protein